MDVKRAIVALGDHQFSVLAPLPERGVFVSDFGENLRHDFRYGLDLMPLLYTQEYKRVIVYFKH